MTVQHLEGTKVPGALCSENTSNQSHVVGARAPEELAPFQYGINRVSSQPPGGTGGPLCLLFVNEEDESYASNVHTSFRHTSLKQEDIGLSFPL